MITKNSKSVSKTNKTELNMQLKSKNNGTVALAKFKKRLKVKSNGNSES